MDAPSPSNGEGRVHVSPEKPESNCFVPILFAVLIAFTIFSGLYYPFKYHGKYGISYFMSYQDPSMTELALDYQEQSWNAFSEDGIEIIGAEITPDGRFSHSVTVSFSQNNVKKEINFIIGYFRSGSSVWLDFKDPESIRVHISDIDKHIDKKHQYANTVKQAVNVTVASLHEHLSDEKYWRQTFYE